MNVEVKQAQGKGDKITWSFSMDGLTKIENDLFGMANKVKKIKKIIVYKYENARDVTLYYSTTFPMIVAVFYEKNVRKQMFMKNFLKKLPLIETKIGVFDDVFGRIYSRVDPRYYCLVSFALRKANISSLKTTQRSLMHEDDGNNVMFFYFKGEDQIYFTMFGQEFEIVFFGSSFIEEEKSKFES